MIEPDFSRLVGMFRLVRCSWRETLMETMPIDAVPVQRANNLWSGPTHTTLMEPKIHTIHFSSATPNACIYPTSNGNLTSYRRGVCLGSALSRENYGNR